jgi:hypothetical protein
MRAIVYHSSYGCDTGCCGHVVLLTDAVPEPDNRDFPPDGDDRFQFEHPHGESIEEFVRSMVTEAFGEEHVADIDWDSCVVVDD